MKPLDYQLYYRRHLPHMQPPGATVFITFRLAGSIPRFVLDQWAHDKQVLERQAATIQSTKIRAKQELEIKREWFRRMEKSLDCAESWPVWLKNATVSDVVAQAFKFLDGKKYRLNAFCIMSNHVHLVITPLLGRFAKSTHSSAPPPQYCSLTSILHSLKRHTAREANKILKRSGQFWDHESYDHYIRDEAEFGRVIHYVLNNPVKAGLCKRWEDWQWSFFESQK